MSQPSHLPDPSEALPPNVSPDTLDYLPEESVVPRSRGAYLDRGGAREQELNRMISPGDAPTPIIGTSNSSESS